MCKKKRKICNVYAYWSDSVGAFISRLSCYVSRDMRSWKRCSSTTSWQANLMMNLWSSSKASSHAILSLVIWSLRIGTSRLRMNIPMSNTITNRLIETWNSFRFQPHTCSHGILGTLSNWPMSIPTSNMIINREIETWNSLLFQPHTFSHGTLS